MIGFCQKTDHFIYKFNLSIIQLKVQNKSYPSFKPQANVFFLRKTPFDQQK